MTTPNPEQIIQIATGYMAAKHLFTANEVGLFAALGDGSLPLADLSERVKLTPEATRILADAMVALGILTREGANYANGVNAATFLAGKTSADLRPFLRFWDHISYPSWAHFADALLTGKPSFPHLTDEANQIFSEGVAALTAGAAQALPEVYDFAPSQHVVDVGGGMGAFLVAIARKYPNLRLTLFETPQVAAVARRALAGQAINVSQGDFFTDPLPDASDTLILANVIHLFNADHVRSLLRRLREQIQSPGRLLLIDFWTDATHTQPPFAALMAGEFRIVSGEGDVYSVDEMGTWLAETGWRFSEHRPVNGPASVIIAATAS